MTDAELIATKKIGIFPRTVTHEQAKQAARNLIDAHFNNKDGKGVLVSVPAQPDDDDILLVDYIVQQIERLETLTAENERLREALSAYTEYCNICHGRGAIIEEDIVTGKELWTDCRGCAEARAALKQGEQ